MADKTGITWTNSTWNPITGCAKISPGCKHCYALREWPRMSANPKTVYFGRTFGDVQCHSERLDQPIRWTKPRLIFVNSMSDLFHVDVPTDFIDKVFAVAALAPQHTFQVLTKRADRMQAYFSDENVWARIEVAARVIHRERTGKQIAGKTLIGPLPNVWLGVSVENQDTANERIPLLMRTPAAIRWISAEPLLGPVDLSATPAGDILTGETRLNWVVVGGESGPKSRPMHRSWPRRLRDQCVGAGVPFFFKQWGAWRPMRKDEIRSQGMQCDLVSDGSRPTIASGTFYMAHQIESMLSDPDHSWQHPIVKVAKGESDDMLDGIQYLVWPQ